MEILTKIKQPESRKLEFKERFPEKSDILKTIIAFSNGAGGDLIIGVSDKERDVVGIKNPLELEEKISNMINDSIHPQIVPYIYSMNIEGKVILVIQVLPGNTTPYFLKSKGLEKGVYIRIGSSNRLANIEIIAELRRKSLGVSYDYNIDRTLTINDFDSKSIGKFFNKIGVSNHTYRDIIKWKFINQNNGDIFPTIAGLILFGKEHLFDYEYAGVRVTKFKNNTLADIESTKDFYLPIISNVENIFIYVLSLIGKESVLSGVERIEQTIIPPYAVRETIVNAIVHRDYSIKSNIKINIFSDRIEIISPGILYGNIDIADLGSGLSECRNRNIVRVFRKMNFMEELGTGIYRIIELYKNKNLQNPEFYEQGNYFRVTLPQIKMAVSKEEIILEIIKSKQEVSASLLAKELNYHHNTILKYLHKLLEENKVIKMGKGKSSRYKINQSHQVL
ncbi:MAG: putative DNA binding domain-containing protein [Candidatus Cloacimonetes bacterium]|nr:putative DNA binding domain-containing protein [Candidatus Cloacimonadota bacterium]